MFPKPEKLQYKLPATTYREKVKSGAQLARRLRLEKYDPYSAVIYAIHETKHAIATNMPGEIWQTTSNLSFLPDEEPPAREVMRIAIGPFDPSDRDLEMWDEAKQHRDHADHWVDIGYNPT